MQAQCQPAADNKGLEISIYKYIYIALNSPALWEIDAECGLREEWAYLSCGVRTAKDTVMYLCGEMASPSNLGRAGC